MKNVACWLVVVVAFCGAVSAQPPTEMTDSKPRPEFRNVAYGPHERNVFDLWTVKSEKPAPLVLFFHGGGFVGGDKWSVDRALLDAAREKGMAVASANYRFSKQAAAPASMEDGALTLQFIRAHAAEYGVDPSRVALCGSSAGAGISLWIAFHDDMAKADGDAAAKQSTRVTCVGIFGGQCTYNPRVIREVIGGRAWEHMALPMLVGIKPEDLDAPGTDALFEKASALPMLSKDDPPVIGYYQESPEPLKPGPNMGPKLYYPDFGKELPGQDKPGQGIHHPRFGTYLKEKMNALGIECVIKLKGDYPNDAGRKQAEALAEKDMAAFFARQLAR